MYAIKVNVAIKVIDRTLTEKEMFNYLLYSCRHWKRCIIYFWKASIYQAPTTWNQLPVSVRHASSVCSFNSSLKTYLFSQTFSSVLLPWDVCVCVYACVCVCVCVGVWVCVCVIWIFDVMSTCMCKIVCKRLGLSFFRLGALSFHYYYYCTYSHQPHTLTSGFSQVQISRKYSWIQCKMRTLYKCQTQI